MIHVSKACQSLTICNKISVGTNENCYPLPNQLLYLHHLIKFFAQYKWTTYFLNQYVKYRGVTISVFSH